MESVQFSSLEVTFHSHSVFKIKEMTLTIAEHEILTNKTVYIRVEYVYEHKCNIHLPSSST